MTALAPLRFLLELCTLVALAVAGAALGWWAAVLAPAVLVAVWGRFVAPNSAHRLDDPARLLLELGLFAATGAALAAAGHPLPAAALATSSAAVAVGVRRLEG